MKIIFCNIAYMKNYCGSENDMPVNDENTGEIYNFLDYDGKCYGFFEIGFKNLDIERIENNGKNKVDDVLVVWVAKPDKSDAHSVIVGWYKNATVYRYSRTNLHYRYGVYRDYYISAEAENCYLLPENRRDFIITRASKNGKGKGMGQSDVWYADSEYAKKEFVPKVLEYIENYNGEFINKVWTDEMTDRKYIGNKTDSELIQCAFDEKNFEKALTFVNTSLENSVTKAKLNLKATFLTLEYQFTRAIPYFEKVIEIDNSNNKVHLNLFDLYMLTNQPEKAVSMGKILENHGLYSVYDNETKIYITAQMIELFALLGRKDSAEKYLEKLHTLQNVNDEVLNFYCVLVENMQNIT